MMSPSYKVPVRLDRPGASRTYRRPAGVAAADALGRVTVTLRNGRRITAGVLRSTGDRIPPLSDRELVAKFCANCGSAIADPVQLAHRFLEIGNQLAHPLLRDTAVE